MTEGEQLREALAESLWALDPPPDECEPDSRGWADAEDRNRERVSTVLAVLDQQGWVSAEDANRVLAEERGWLAQVVAERDAALREAARYEQVDRAVLQQTLDDWWEDRDTTLKLADWLIEKMGWQVTEGEEG